MNYTQKSYVKGKWENMPHGDPGGPGILRGRRKAHLETHAFAAGI